MSFDKTAAESNRIIGDQIFDGSSGVVSISINWTRFCAHGTCQRHLYSTLHYFILFGVKPHFEFEFSNYLSLCKKIIMSAVGGGGADTKELFYEFLHSKVSVVILSRWSLRRPQLV